MAGRSRSPALLVLVLAGSLLAACGGAESEAGSDRSLTIVATTTIVGDLVSNVVGERADVEVLMPLGADPHDFQASAQQIAAVNRADLVVANGLGLEESLVDVLAAASEDGVRVLELAPLVDPLPFGGSAHEHDSDEHDSDEHDSDEHDSDEHDSDEHDSDDPHVWLDPVRMADAVGLVAAELATIRPSIDWTAQADAYAAELEATHERSVEMLSAVPEARRRLVTNHDALGYFADRYGFIVIGTVIPAGSTLADPSSEALAELIDVMEREGVSVIFGETTQPEALADAVAAELGQDAQVVELYTGSLGEPGSGADTLVGLLETNAGRIATALGE